MRGLATHEIAATIGTSGGRTLSRAEVETAIYGGWWQVRARCPVRWAGWDDLVPVARLRGARR